MIDAPPTRIVLVDDNLPVCAALKALIDSTEDLITVGVAHDGATGLALCLDLAPDLAVLDISMPGGGPSLVRSLNEAMPNLHLLAFSGQPEEGVVLEMMDAGTLSYVAKGTKVEDLLRAIRRAAEGKMTVSPTVAPLVSRWMYDHNQKPPVEES
ncbi:MAG: response regulator [Candidatus Dormibacteria bacterium]